MTRDPNVVNVELVASLLGSLMEELVLICGGKISKEIHAAGGGVLMACLASAIAAKEVKAVALSIVNWHKELAPAGDTTCVFCDSAFADDVTKANMAPILNQHGIQNVRSL